MANKPKKTLGLEIAEAAVTPPPVELEPAIEKKPLNPGTTRKRDIPQGLWTKCPKCEEMIFDRELEDNLKVCPQCTHHFPITAWKRIKDLTEPDSFEEADANMISVDTLEFTGTAVIGAKKEWPTWRPTNEMIEREPQSYSKFIDNDYVQPGGPDNPLGARALYLFQNGRDTYFRIHGTTAPESIGRSVSNGCIRMLNEHVIDLYNRVPVGTPVTVL